MQAYFSRPILLTAKWLMSYRIDLWTNWLYHKPELLWEQQVFNLVPINRGVHQLSPWECLALVPYLSSLFLQPSQWFYKLLLFCLVIYSQIVQITIETHGLIMSVLLWFPHQRTEFYLPLNCNPNDSLPPDKYLKNINKWRRQYCNSTFPYIRFNTYSDHYIFYYYLHLKSYKKAKRQKKVKGLRKHVVELVNPLEDCSPHSTSSQIF